MKYLCFFVLLLVAFAAVKPQLVSTLPPVVEDQRYIPVTDDDGIVHMIDTWQKASDIAEPEKYDPDTQNVYSLFTRQNPTVGQPILLGSTGTLGSSNYNANLPTIFIIHGWRGSLLGKLFTVLIPALLIENVNVFAVDWSKGAGTINYFAAVTNTYTSGQSVARFVNWLMASTGTTPKQLHFVGHSLGGHQVGIAGRYVNGTVAYITALDPAFPVWVTNVNKFRATDGAYTEVIHTNAGIQGYPTPLGMVDFYANCGIHMPGCDGISCDHERCIYYFAESLSSVFTGTRCATYIEALACKSLQSGSLQMGGRTPKSGSSGVYYFHTNAASPFSRG